MIRYKLTDQNMQTYKGYQWKLGKWYKTSGVGELCGEGWLHCYCSPLLAILHNPIHADIENPRLFEVEVRGECKTDGQMKEGWTEMRIAKEIELPKITSEQRIKYAILCAGEVCTDEGWTAWAVNWWCDIDRSSEAAWAACAVRGAARAAWAAARAARGAARAAAWAARVDLASLAEYAMEYDNE